MTALSDFDAIIAGGGPAGASAAIHLAMRGVRVLLAEQKKFPRAKLCGEFISPECAVHFERLGVTNQMFAAGPARLSSTVFYSRQGENVTVPSAWFGAGEFALGLSRAEMDERLLRRAVAAGACVLEDAQVVGLVGDRTSVRGVSVKHGGAVAEYRAPLIIDATGRSRALCRRLDLHRTRSKTRRMPLVAFKAHLENAAVAPGTCEIYFYGGGYGGLSSIENSLSNICFIAAARDVRKSGADAERVMREVVCRNHRAARVLSQARTCFPWLAVSLEGFGRREVAPVDGLLAIGDAASFIDPFTGSGMLMALESGELVADLIAGYLSSARTALYLGQLNLDYQTAYHRKFDSRLKACAWMRRAAFVPGLANVAIRLFRNDRLRQFMSRATRGLSRDTYSQAKRVDNWG
ncbi:MAG: FAD-dependent monooxygenase [Acidobacteriota bacterium]